MRITQATLILIILISYLSVSAQNATDDLKKINQAYVDNNSFSMNLAYMLYENDVAASPISVEKGEYKKHNVASYYSVGGIETVQSNRYNLVVDNNEKNITLLKVFNIDSEKELKEKNKVLEGLEQTLTSCNEISYKEISNKLAEYTFSLNNVSEYSKIKLAFNRKTYFIDYLELYYRVPQNIDNNQEGKKVKPKLLISYSDIELNPSINENDFSYLKYLKKKNGRLVCKDEYKQYTLNNQL